MPRSTKPRKAYRPRVTVCNTVEIALARTRKLRPAEVQGQMRNLRSAFHSFTSGRDCLPHWRSLTDAANVAETFAQQGIGSGPDAAAVIRDAQEALSAVHQRRQAGGSWTLYAREHDALQWLLALHAVQLESCDYGAFEQAWQATHNRLSQALRGNAPRNAIVITGDIAP